MNTTLTATTPKARMNHKANCCILHGCAYDSATCSVLKGTVVQAHACSKCPTPADVLAGAANAYETSWLIERGLMHAGYSRVSARWGAQPMARPATTTVVVVRADLSTTDKLDALTDGVIAVGGKPALLEANSVEEVVSTAEYYGFSVNTVFRDKALVAATVDRDSLAAQWLKEDYAPVKVGKESLSDRFNNWERAHDNATIKAKAWAMAEERHSLGFVEVGPWFFLMLPLVFFNDMSKASTAKKIAKELKIARRHWWSVRRSLSV